MNTVTVRLPEALAMEIEAEARQRGVSKSDIVRERLRVAASPAGSSASLEAIADLVGSVDGLPSQLSGQRKRFLKTTRYGQARRTR